MKICILTPRFPFPENGGDVLRINNIARYLKGKNHYLILVSFTQSNPDLDQAHRLYDEIITVPQNRLISLFYTLFFMIMGRPMQCGYYFSLKMRRCVQSVEKQYTPDLYISHLLRMAPYLDNPLHSKTIIEMTDALSKTYQLSTQSSNRSFKHLIYAIEYKLIQRYENYVIHRFPKVVLVSNADVHYLSKDQTVPSLVCLTNGIQTMGHPPLTYNSNKICFIGNMRTLQNQDAVTFFVEDILPFIIRQNPNTVFYIVGAEPPANIQKLASDPHIVVTGYVEHLEDVIGDACLAVAPVRIAAGIQNKVLMALAQGIPVILSSLIAPAIPELQDEINCFIKDDPQQIALKCLQLMNNPSLRQQLSVAGSDMVATHYQWDKILNNYEIIGNKS